MMYGKGISAEGNILDIGVNMGFVQKSGAWFSYGGMRIGQGRDNAKNFLIEHPEMLAEIDAKIRAKLNESDADSEINEETTSEE
jgi:recombination protein RecA